MMESGSNAENARGSGAMEYSSGGQADRAGSVDGKMNVDIKPQDEVKKDSMDTQGKNCTTFYGSYILQPKNSTFKWTFKVIHLPDN